MVARRLIVLAASAAGGLLGIAAAASAASPTASVAVTVHNVPGAQGTITVGLCDADHFMKRCAYEATAHAAPGDVAVRVPGVAPGRYVVVALLAEEPRCILHTDAATDAGVNKGFSVVKEGETPSSFDAAAVTVAAPSTAAEATLGAYDEAVLREGKECGGRPQG